MGHWKAKDSSLYGSEQTPNVIFSSSSRRTQIDAPTYQLLRSTKTCNCHQQRKLQVNYNHSTRTHITFMLLFEIPDSLSSDPVRRHVTPPPVTFKSLLLPAAIWQTDTSERTNEGPVSSWQDDSHAVISHIHTSPRNRIWVILVKMDISKCPASYSAASRIESILSLVFVLLHVLSLLYEIKN